MSATQLTRLTEAISEYDKIDRAAGIIRGVKILSSKSRNGRRYLQEAMEKARPRYEKSKVYLDHIDPKATKRRKTDERWGQLQDVRCTEDGLYGDLHYLKSHRCTESILESIERFEDAGLSHDAGGKVRQENGEDVVYEIAEVYSVDFVQNPATNSNLFEERQTMPRKLLSVLREHVKVKLASSLLANLTEMGDMYSDATPMMEPDVEGASDPDADIAAALKTAVMAVLDSEDDTATKISKIKLILGVKDKIEGTGAAATPAATEGDAMSEELTNLRAELTQLREERSREKSTSECRALLESLGIDATEVRVNALIPLKEDGRKLLAAEFPKRAIKPASSPSVMNKQLQEDRNAADLPADVDGLKKLLGVGSH
jgi:hypothetical protein